MAWRRVSAADDQARIVYDVLADALLRWDDPDHAIDVLNDARARWPNDAVFVPRLAAAQAMRQEPKAALATLQGYLDDHRSDTDALRLALRLFYDAREADRPLVGEAADRELAATYAGWYKSAGGPNQPLIERWLAFILKS